MRTPWRTSAGTRLRGLASRGPLPDLRQHLLRAEIAELLDLQRCHAVRDWSHPAAWRLASAEPARGPSRTSAYSRAGGSPCRAPSTARSCVGRLPLGLGQAPRGGRSVVRTPPPPGPSPRDAPMAPAPSSISTTATPLSERCQEIRSSIGQCQLLDAPTVGMCATSRRSGRSSRPPGEAARDRTASTPCPCAHWPARWAWSRNRCIRTSRRRPRSST